MPALSPTGRRLLAGLDRFGRWWLSELKGLVPGSLRLPAISSARVDILPGWHRVELVRVQAGQGERLTQEKPLVAFAAEDWAELAALTDRARVRVILDAPMIHIVRLGLPRAARAHLASAVALQLRDHAPVLPSLLDWRIASIMREGDKLVVEVLIVKTATLDAIRDGFAGHGLAPPPVHGRTGGRLLALRRGGSNRPGVRLATAWWAAGLILLASPLVAMLALQWAIASTSAEVDRLGQAVAPRLRAERALEEKAHVARGLREILAAPTVSETMDDLARRVPVSGYAADVARSRNGTFALTIVTTDPGAVNQGLAHDPRLPALRLISQDKGTDGSFTLHYQTGPR